MGENSSSISVDIRCGQVGTEKGDRGQQICLVAAADGLVGESHWGLSEKNGK